MPTKAPKSGHTYEFSRTRDGKQVTEKFHLDRLLNPYSPTDEEIAAFYADKRVDDKGQLIRKVGADLYQNTAGLTMIPKVEGGRSQAETFASYALQCGFTTEDDVFARWAYLNGSLRNVSDVLGQMIAQCTRQSSDRAYDTMVANEEPRSIAQENLAKTLIPRLVNGYFEPHARRLGAILSADEDEDGPQGANLHRAISRAFELLGETPKKRSNGNTQTSAKMAPSPSSNEVDPTTVTPDAAKGPF